MDKNCLETISDLQGFIVIDGGLATELERAGHDLTLDRLWSARLIRDDPEAISQIHAAYFDAGADVAITATYQAQTCFHIKSSEYLFLQCLFHF